MSANDEQGTYRSIRRSFVRSPGFKALPERAQLTLLICAVEFGPSGIEKMPIEALAHTLTVSASYRSVLASLRVLASKGFIQSEDGVTWLRGQLLDNPHLRSADANHRKSIQRHVADLPQCPIVGAYIRAHADWFPATDDVVSKRLKWALAETARGGTLPETLDETLPETLGEQAVGSRQEASGKSETATATTTRAREDEDASLANGNGNRAVVVVAAPQVFEFQPGIEALLEEHCTGWTAEQRHGAGMRLTAALSPEGAKYRGQSVRATLEQLLEAGAALRDAELKVPRRWVEWILARVAAGEPDTPRRRRGGVAQRSYENAKRATADIDPHAFTAYGDHFGGSPFSRPRVDTTPPVDESPRPVYGERLEHVKQYDREHPGAWADAETTARKVLPRTASPADVERETIALLEAREKRERERVSA